MICCTRYTYVQIKSQIKNKSYVRFSHYQNDTQIISASLSLSLSFSPSLSTFLFLLSHIFSAAINHQ